MTVARRLRTALRSLHPANVVTLALALVLGAGGGAAAATGGNFVLGKANTETTTATLSNSQGTPLKLSAPAGTAPLAVNRTALVPNLNAQYLSGFTFDQLAVQGGDGYTRPGTATPIDFNGEKVVSTGNLSPGTYYVNATAALDVAAGDVQGSCFIVKGSDPTSVINAGGEYREGSVEAAETAAIAVTGGDTIQEWCETNGFNGSTAGDAGITAIRVLFFSGTPGARTGVTRAAALRSLAHPAAGTHQSPR
jgi:hypothetical protein